MRAEWFGIKVTRQAGDEQRCICPFHDDKRPSASFNVVKNVFYCHTCKIAYGVEQLAQRLGLSLEEVDGNNSSRNVFSLELAEEDVIGQHPFDWGDRPREYMLSRVGYISDWLEYSTEHDAILFPMIDLKGRRVGAMARYIAPSYNRYRLFGKKTPLWPLQTVDITSRTTIIVEGYFSFLKLSRSLQEHGCKTTKVYAMSGSYIGEQLKEVVSQIRGTVIFLLDNDVAGKRCAKYARRLFPRSRQFVIDDLDEKSYDGIWAVLELMMSLK